MSIQNKINNTLHEVGELASKATGLKFLCKDCDKSYCCEHQKRIVVTTKEFTNIVDLITDEHISNAKEELSKDYKSGYKCPFLIDGRCSIYDNRFAVCASYGVCGDTVENTCTIQALHKDIAIIDPAEVIYRLDENTLVEMINLNSDITDILQEFKRRYNEN
jgi:Fe-S-cluster containining protein